MKRLFFLVAVILGVCLVGTTGRAQFSNNFKVVATTNVTALTPLGNGFGVALLGYGLPDYNTNLFIVGSSNVFFFGAPMGQPSASDATIGGGKYQFYAVSTDKDGFGTSNQSDVVAFKVTSPLTSPSSLTIVRTWVARTDTNSTGRVGGLGANGISRSGTVTIRADNSGAPTSVGTEQAMFVLNANTPSTTVISTAIDPAALITNGGSGGLLLGSMGRNQGLMAGSTFGNTQYVARANIPGSIPLLAPHAQLIASDNSRGAFSINETARVLATWKKSPDEVAFGGNADLATRVAVFYYNDNGSSVSFDTTRGDGQGSNVWAFGTRSGNDVFNDHVDTNAADFFSATPFNGPAQISINDNGEMAFPVVVNAFIGRIGSNEVRCADQTGILFKKANTNIFQLVVSSMNSNIFMQVPPGTVYPTNTGSNVKGDQINNLFSPPVLDNRGGVFFEAAYTNVSSGGTNYFSETAISNAVFYAAPNQYPNPASWTTTAIIHEGDSFVEPTSGDTIMIDSIPLASGSGDARANVPRSLGANAINRTPLPGTANALGGVIVCVTFTNTTAHTRFDGLLYIAPYYTNAITYPFAITSITRSGNDVTLTWNGQRGSNVVQAAPGGNYSGANFADLTPPVTNVLSESQVTSYTHVNGATGSANRYYRVKVIPLD